jgi:signal peptidase I
MQDKIYSDYGLGIENTSSWIFKHGFSKGDIIFIVRPSNIKIGDVIVFNAGQRNPIIHRVINISDDFYTTKGDHNYGFLPYEKKISQEQIMGKAIFRVPYIGWIKLIFFDWRNSSEQRGLCR